MSTAKNWISAFRLRTLFLAVATVVLGSSLAGQEGSFNLYTFLLTLLLAVSIQILANLANDLGDYQKGTDTTGHRQGPERTLQSGKITAQQMKRAIALFALICVATGLYLIINVMPHVSFLDAVVLFGIGIVSLLAALFYTLGKHAYGYKGWGDFLAFLFFGPVPVIGTYFLHTHSFDFLPVLPSLGIGIISTMILNINNMRDIENDRASGKITIAVKLGIKRAAVYHGLLTLASFLSFFSYNILYAPAPWYRFLYLIAFFLLFNIWNEVHRKQGQALDPYLKFTSLSGFLIAILFSICITA